MDVKPDYKSIGDLFRDANVFRIPTYQRGYAWEKENVQDFIDDLQLLADNPDSEHFFGCLVCAQEEKVGGHEQVNSLIDGQQRLTTFLILSKCIIEEYEKYCSDEDHKDYIEEKIKELKERYVVYKKTENKKPITIKRMILSRKDDAFFSRMMEGIIENPRLDSEKRLNGTYKLLKGFINDYSRSEDLGEALDKLERLERSINERCNVIHLVSSKVSDAYKLFQTINDRGKALNQTDLIRAKTLGLSDSGDENCFEDIENLWDELDRNHGRNLEKHLGIYLSSRTGHKVKTATFYDQFMASIFNSGKVSAEQIKEKLLDISNSLNLSSKILDGDWPFDNEKLSSWHRNRLALLVGSLKHTHPAPLLLSAIKLGEKDFFKLVRVLEVFFFRYKYLCNNKIDSATKIYYTACFEIQCGTFNIQKFTKELRTLMDESATDQKFSSAIENLLYPRDAKGLKYLLLGLEENWRWHLEEYKGGLKKRDSSVDTSKVYDFKTMTIEHVYPRNSEVVSVEMEELKDSFGNLTLLDPEMNSSLGNQEFIEKKTYFIEKSRVLMNKDFRNYNAWRKEDLEDRRKNLIQAALKVFRI